MYDFVGVQVLKPLHKLDEPIHDEFFLQQFIFLLVFADVDWKIAIYFNITLHSQYSIMMMRILSSRKYY